MAGAYTNGFGRYTLRCLGWRLLNHVGKSMSSVAWFDHPWRCYEENMGEVSHNELHSYYSNQLF